MAIRPAKKIILNIANQELLQNTKTTSYARIQATKMTENFIQLQT
jgi:hypothetical protein